VGLGFLLRAVAAPAPLVRRHWVLVAAVLAQGVLGAVQYALRVPEVLVSLHVLGACLVTAAAAALSAASTDRPAVPATADASPEPATPTATETPATPAAARPATAEAPESTPAGLRAN